MQTKKLRQSIPKVNIKDRDNEIQVKIKNRDETQVKIKNRDEIQVKIKNQNLKFGNQVVVLTIFLLQMGKSNKKNTPKDREASPVRKPETPYRKAKIMVQKVQDFKWQLQYLKGEAQADPAKAAFDVLAELVDNDIVYRCANCDKYVRTPRFDYEFECPTCKNAFCETCLPFDAKVCMLKASNF